MDEEEGEETGVDIGVLLQTPEISGGVYTKGVYSEPVSPIWKHQSVKNSENISPPTYGPKSRPSQIGNTVSGKGPAKLHSSCLGGTDGDVKLPTTSRNRKGSVIRGRDVQSKGPNELGLEYRKAMALERHKRRNLKMQMGGLTATDTEVVVSASPSVNPKLFTECQETVLHSQESKGCSTTAMGHPYTFLNPDPSFSTRKLYYTKLSPEARDRLYTLCLSLVTIRYKMGFIVKLRAFTRLRTRTTSITTTRTAAELLTPCREVGCARLICVLDRVERKWQGQKLKVALRILSGNIVLRRSQEDKYFALERLLFAVSERMKRKKLRALLSWRMICLQGIARDAKEDELSIMRKDYLEKEKAVNRQHSRSLRFTLGICRALELSRRLNLRVQASAFIVWQCHYVYSNRIASALKTCVNHCLTIQRRRALVQWRENVRRKAVGRIVMSHLARLANATKKDNMYRVMLRWKVRCLSVDKLLLSMARKNPLRRHEEFSWLCVLSATRMQAVKLMQEGALVPTPKGGAVVNGSGSFCENRDAAVPSLIVRSEDSDGVTSQPIPPSGEIQALAMSLNRSQASSHDGLRAQHSLAVSTAASSVEIFPGLPPDERGDVLTPSTSRLTPLLHPGEGRGSDVSDLGYSLSPMSEAMSFFKLSTEHGSKCGESSLPDKLFSGAVNSSNNSGVDMQQSNSSTSDVSFMHPSPPPPEDGKLRNIASPPTQGQQRELFHHQWVAADEYEPDPSLAVSTSSFLQVSSSSVAAFPDTLTVMGAPLSPEDGGSCGRSLFRDSPTLPHSSEGRRPTQKDNQYLFESHSVTAVRPNTSPGLSPDGDNSAPAILQLLTTNPLSRPHGIDKEEVSDTVAPPALQAKNWGGANKFVLHPPPTANADVSVLNVTEEPISPPRGGGGHYYDGSGLILPEYHPVNLSVAERGASRSLQYLSDGDGNTNVNACLESAQTASLLNVQQPFERAHEEGVSKGPRWYNAVGVKTKMQDSSDADVHRWSLSPANDNADSAVGPRVLRSEQQVILRRDTTHQRNTIDVESSQRVPNNSERLPYPYQPHLNHQLKNGGHEKDQATIQDQQVVSLPSSYPSCTKHMPKQQELVSSSSKALILPQCANSAADGARNEFQHNNTLNTAPPPPLLLQHNEDAHFTGRISSHEQLPQQQIGHSVAAAALPPKHAPSPLVSRRLSDHECNGINEMLPTVSQPQHPPAFNNSDGYAEDIQFQCMANPDNSPSVSRDVEPNSNMVVEVQNDPYRRNRTVEELQHYRGGDVGELVKQCHEECHHPERMYDVNVNNTAPSYTEQNIHHLGGVSEQRQQLEDNDEMMRYEMGGNDLYLPHDEHRGRSYQLYNELPKMGHEQQKVNIERRIPKSGQQHHPQEMGRNITAACNPNPPSSTQQEHHQQYNHPTRSFRRNYGSDGVLEHVRNPEENGYTTVFHDEFPVGQNYAHGSSKRNYHVRTANTSTSKRITIEERQPDYQDKICTNSSSAMTGAHEEQQQYDVDQRCFPEHEQPEEYHLNEKRIAVQANLDHDRPMAQEHQQQQHYPKRNNLEYVPQGGIRVTTDPPEYRGRRTYKRDNNFHAQPEEGEYCCDHNSRKYNYEPQNNTAVQRFTGRGNIKAFPYSEKRFVIVDNECPTVKEQEQYYSHSNKNCEQPHGRQGQPHEVITVRPEYCDGRRYIVSGGRNVDSSGGTRIQQDENYDGGENTEIETERWPESVEAAEYTENRYGDVLPRGKAFSRSGVRRPTPPPTVNGLGGRRRSSGRATGMQQYHQQQTRQRRNIIHDDGLAPSYNNADTLEDTADEYFVSDVIIGSRGGGNSRIMHHMDMNPPPPPVLPCRPRQGVPCEGGRRRKGLNHRHPQNSCIKNKGKHLSKSGRNDHYHQYYRDDRVDNVNDDELQDVLHTNEGEDDVDFESDEESIETTTPTRRGGSSKRGMRVVAPRNVSVAPDFVQSGVERETAKTLHEKLNALESGLEHVEASMSTSTTTSTPHHHQLRSSLSKKNSKEIQQRLLAVEKAVNGLRKESSLSHDRHRSFDERGSDGGVLEAAAAAPDTSDMEHRGDGIGSGWASDVNNVRQRLKKARNRLEKLQMEAEAFTSELTPSLKSNKLRNQRHRLNSALNLALGSSYS